MTHPPWHIQVSNSSDTEMQMRQMPVSDFIRLLQGKAVDVTDDLLICRPDNRLAYRESILKALYCIGEALNDESCGYDILYDAMLEQAIAELEKARP